MDLDYLKYFMLIADTGSITKAAASANISQPSMSRILSIVETDAGVKLFDRIGRSLKLNSNGKLYLEAATTAVTALSDAKEQLRSSNSEPMGSVTIAIQSVQSGFPRALVDFNRKYGGIKLLTTSLTDEQKMTPDLCDFCVLNPPVENDLLSHCHLFAEPVVAVVSAKHPLASSEEVSLTEIAKYELILPKSEKFTRLIQSYFYTCGCTMKIFRHIDDDREQLLNVNLGQYVVLAPITAFPPASFSDSVYLKISYPRCNSIVDLAWWKNTRLSHPAMLLKEFLMSYYSDSSSALEENLKTGNGQYSDYENNFFSRHIKKTP